MSGNTLNRAGRRSARLIGGGRETAVPRATVGTYFDILIDTGVACYGVFQGDRPITIEGIQVMQCFLCSKFLTYPVLKALKKEEEIPVYAEIDIFANIV